jgi:hypothetical protein
MRSLAVPALMAAALALTACGSGGHHGDEGAPTVRGATRAAPAQSTAPAATATGQPQVHDADGYKVAVTVHRYRQPLPSQDRPSRAGYTYAGVDVRLCVKASPGSAAVSLSADPWSLRYGDDTSVEPALADADMFSVALYPQEPKAIPVGDCARGWVVFEVPAGKRPTQAVYTPTGTDAPAVPLRWAIS